MEMAKKTVKLLMLFTLGFAAVYILRNIIAGFQYYTSFPWWSSIVFAVFYFGPTILFEGLLYGILVLIEKRKK